MTFSASKSAWALALVLAASASARAQFAASVVDYAPGDVSPTFREPTAALGMPHGDTSFGVLTPFNAPFLGSHIVGIGDGGRLTLALSQPAATGAGRTLGVHAAVGLIDHDWPNGFAGAVATTYTNPRVADVFVSDDGDRWHALGPQTFDIPTNFYAEGVTTPGYQESPGTVVANFVQPFVSALASLDALGWQQMLGVFDGSAGGTWLDLTDVPYAAVNYVRFDVTGADQVMYVDAVVAIPEPSVGAVLLLVAALVRRP